VKVDLVIAGASARAAAFSALRAGLAPACIDLFADADLRALCPVVRIPGERYPEDLVAAFDRLPAAPWLYTGALENRPDIVRAISAGRLLWGCSPPAIELVRSPGVLHDVLTQAGLRSPRVILPAEPIPESGRWLLKPLAGAAGFGIRETAGTAAVPECFYAQQYMEGANCSGLFVGHAFGAHFLGATAQLSGTEWLHAAPFHYAGNIGPLTLPFSTIEAFRKLGNVLAGHFGLRGIFGVDCILADGIPCVLEINPRYTASVEVWEYARRRSALKLHRQVFEQKDHCEIERLNPFVNAMEFVGKGIYYAREAVTIPQTRPWPAPDLAKGAGYHIPAYADLPDIGDHIQKGHPVLTILVRGASVEECMNELESRSTALDRWLFAT
jgi:predicted ATP-grasp superfamily ATP-dependent carboligase